MQDADDLHIVVAERKAEHAILLPLRCGYDDIGLFLVLSEVFLLSRGVVDPLLTCFSFFAGVGGPFSVVFFGIVRAVLSGVGRVVGVRSFIDFVQRMLAQNHRTLPVGNLPCDMPTGRSTKNFDNYVSLLGMMEDGFDAAFPTGRAGTAHSSRLTVSPFGRDVWNGSCSEFGAGDDPGRPLLVSL